MEKSTVQCVKSIVLTSDQPEVLARFYCDTLQLPLEPERHRGTSRHFAGQFGPLHLAIHDRKDFWLPEAADATPAGTIVSFTVDDIAAIEAHLERLGVPVVARNQIGPMQFVAFRDPDGRYVCCGTPWPSRQ